jgi:hypothetical protein
MSNHSMGRRPVPAHLKKQTSEYPQLAFRLSQQDKVKLLRLADEAAKAINQARTEDEFFVTKGDVFVRALYLGFARLRKK